MPAPKPLGMAHPEVLLSWNSKANGDADPRALISRDPNKYWWTCPNGHDYQATVRALITGRQCRVCIGSEISSGINDFKTLYPELALDWHPTKNGPISPDSIGVGAKTKYWWLCRNQHEYQSDVWNKVIGKKCRACAGLVAVAGESDFPSRHPELLPYFVPGVNEVETLEGVHPGSELLVGWRCPLGHEWTQAIREISRKRKNPCSTCSNSKVAPGFNDLATRHPNLAAEWDYVANAPVTPDHVTFQTDKPFFWLCMKHQHSWRTSPYKRINENSNCPYCGNYSLLTGFNDIATRHPELAAEWSPRNTLTPEQVITGSHFKFFWQCAEGHEWKTTVLSRLGGENRHGTGCPYCAKSGFQLDKPAVLYFIQSSRYQARKIGITNTGTDRLKNFQSRGWDVLHSVETSRGAIARELEVALFSWLRQDLELPQFLGPQEMGSRGGWTETFSSEGPSNLEVIGRIDAELARLQGA
jgi:hypothetical protein